MSVTDLTFAVYALLTAASIFGAGRLWGPGPRIEGPKRYLTALFAAAVSVMLTYYLVWTDDRVHRAAYMIMNTAVGLAVLSAAGLVLFALRRARRGSLLLASAVVGGLGFLAAAYTIGSRDTFWPPFAVFALALMVAPAAALAPRWRVAGYQPLRDPELFPWSVLAVLGFWGIGETVSLVGLVPGNAWFGRPSLLHFFLAGAVVPWLASCSVPSPKPAPTGGPVPWHLFNPPLSPREADLVEGLRRRLTNKELAAEGGVTESTVKKHLVSVFRKAGVSSRQELFERMDGSP